mmetsp:Transcript_13957/g.20838  ORF Transcript_13957/g.20838 Transcript_13957/m.20838 type:complete len:139 (-) Transcript_13957:268-684(-)|eukprot:CAMPEP_0194073092 /NCGR_PEP_ID=MMETSP0149-20130528/639_1 /TAXON_ID=122233 /ORGANISM="Chaetoceros debilis, Strain MM31A-1" /LENGTH=138 /DNA_ID=CAMNT_0038753053 /DNA_START=67 /DNA_END=483 /DNA_ORIENTATION=+
MKSVSIITILSALFANASAFAPAKQSFVVKPINVNSLQQASLPVEKPAVIENARCSVAQIQTMSLFGLGGPELAVILIAAAFVLGPEKLASLGKDAGKIAGELKEVPKEFQKGLEEGEQQAMSIKQEIEAEVVDKKKD